MLYKRKYLIALYDEDDFPILVAEGIRDLTEKAGKELTKKNVQHMTKRVRDAMLTNRHLRWDGQTATIYLIDATE